MTSMPKENFGKTCEGFFALNTLMDVPFDEAYQFAMPNNAFIASSDMQGVSCSNINLYTGVTKRSDSCMITPMKLHSDNNLKYVFTKVSISDHAQSKPKNSCRAKIPSRM